MKKQGISNRQAGLSTLILILLTGWMTSLVLSQQAYLGPVVKADEVSILVTGDVNHAGVYVFDTPPCLREVIDNAGGLKGKPAVRKWPQYPNPTQGAHIQIRSEDGCVTVSSGSIPAPYKVTLKIPISVNTATQEELEAIPDIGPHLAGKIIHYRPFNNLEELKSVPGIGKIRYLKIQPYLRT